MTFIIILNKILEDMSWKDLYKKGTENRKVIGFTVDELSETTMTEYVESRVNSCSYLIDDVFENEKAKGTKKCIIKGKLKFEDCKNCLKATHLENKIIIWRKTELIWIVLRKIIKNSLKTIN